MPTDATGTDTRSGGPDPRAVRLCLHARAATVERREFEAAMRALDEAGELTPERRRVVAEFADAVVAGLVAPLDAGLRQADPGDDRVRAVRRLFGND